VRVAIRIYFYYSFLATVFPPACAFAAFAIIFIKIQITNLPVAELAICVVIYLIIS